MLVPCRLLNLLFSLFSLGVFFETLKCGHSFHSKATHLISIVLLASSLFYFLLSQVLFNILFSRLFSRNWVLTLITILLCFFPIMTSFNISVFVSLATLALVVRRLVFWVIPMTRCLVWLLSVCGKLSTIRPLPLPFSFSFPLNLLSSISIVVVASASVMIWLFWIKIVVSISSPW